MSLSLVRIRQARLVGVLLLVFATLGSQTLLGQAPPIEQWPECDPHICGGRTTLHSKGLTAVSELTPGDTVYFGPHPSDRARLLCKRAQRVRLAFALPGQDTLHTVINWTQHLPEHRTGFALRNASSLTYLPAHGIALLEYTEGQPFTDWQGTVLLVFNLKTGDWVDIPFQKCIECHSQTPHFSPDSSHFTLPEGIFNLANMAFTPHPRPLMPKVFSRFLSDSLYAVWHHGEDTDHLDILRLPNTLVATHNAPLNLGMGLGLFIGFDPEAAAISDTLVIVSNLAVQHPGIAVENTSQCGYYMLSAHLEGYCQWVPCGQVPQVPRATLPPLARPVYQDRLYLEPDTGALYEVGE